MGVNPAKAREIAVPFGWLTIRVKPAHDLVQVADQNTGMRLASGLEVVLHPEVKFYGTGLEPDPTASRENWRLVDLVHAQDVDVEPASCRLLARGHRELRVVQTLIHACHCLR